MDARYYAVNDRPVALVPTPDGGLDCLVFDFATASMVPDRSYFARVSGTGIGKDVDALTEDEFADAVARWCRDLLHEYERTPIAWEPTGDAATPYRYRLRDRTLTLRANDGGGAAFTLLSENNEVGDVAEWPPAWERPLRLVRRQGLEPEPED